MPSRNIMYAPLHKINFRALGAFVASTIVLMAWHAAPAYAQTPNVGPAPTPTPAMPGPTSGTLSRDGVFGCRAAQYANIGTLTAIGGVYVPVNDAAVTLNTGYLVYKECVLDGVVSMIKNDIASGLQTGAIRAVETSRNGNRQYFTNAEDDLRPYFDAIAVDLISNAKSGAMCAAFKNTVPTAVARSYYTNTRDAGNKELLCPFIGTDAERQAIVGGSTAVNWSKFNSLTQPGGYEVSEYYILKGQTEVAIATYDYNIREQLGWGNGFFPAFDNPQNPLNQRVLTPGTVIANSLQQMIGVGTNILLNANEIDQINGSLQSGLQSSIVADTIRGLTGFSRSQNGQPSYLDRMNAESSSSVRASAVNAALAILGTARQVETLYKTAKEGVATALTNAINKLRAAENTCWGLIIPKVQEKAANEGVSLRIATTTEFSQKIIDEQIQPLATVTVRDLRVSEDALALINQLIASVTNTSSAAAQRAALERLDSMVANNQLHSSSEAQTAQKQKEEVTSAIGTLVDETLKQWGDSEETEVGWCNVNNQAVIDMWFNKWKQ